MKAEELRIGNYVYYNGKIIAVTPNAIKELYYIGDTHANSSTDKRCYKPIPLSEEIMLKCGFTLKLNDDRKTSAKLNTIELIAIGSHNQFVFSY